MGREEEGGEGGGGEGGGEEEREGRPPEISDILSSQNEEGIGAGKFGKRLSRHE